jgi:hypothetical protein
MPKADPEYKRTRVLRNVDNCLPVDTAEHRKVLNLQRLFYDNLRCRDVEYFFMQSPKSTVGYTF